MPNKVLVREDEYSRLVCVTSHMTVVVVMVNIASWYVKKMSLTPFYVLKIACLGMLQKDATHLKCVAKDIAGMLRTFSVVIRMNRVQFHQNLLSVCKPSSMDLSTNAA